MKKFLVISLFITLPLFAQLNKTGRGVENAFLNGNSVPVWINFTGKDLQALQKPGFEFVSAKSLERRAKVAPEGNLIDFTDLPVNPAYISVVENIGVKIRRVSKWLNSVSAELTIEQLREIERLPFVSEVQLVAKWKTVHPEVNNEIPLLQKPLNSVANDTYDYGNSLSQYEISNIPAMHNRGFTGQGVVIGVFDAGFNLLSHEVFNNLNILAAYDFVNNDTNVGDENDMGEGSHGTKVLSLIGGFKQGNLVGPAFNASYILAKTENTDSETPLEEDNWIAAMEWADSIGVDILTTSLGYLDFDPPFQGYTWEDMNGSTARITIASDLAVSKGIAVFNSAGNEGSNSTRNTLSAPADGFAVLAIGSVTATGIRSGFSSVGNTIDGRIKPDLMARGSQCVVVSSINETGYVTGSGTSYSCPIAAGAAALLLEANPQLTPAQLSELLKQTASNSASPNREYGWGIINIDAAYNALTGIGNENSPADFVLYQNYPNPFNPSTTIKFSTKSEGIVKLSIYSVTGELVYEILNNFLPAGQYSVQFDASELSSGVYFYNLNINGFSQFKKMSLVK
ncbi:MAG: S8 family peptidase [Ignavibacteriaceae bacterium]|nr:S8 family peptidase [Ignavibacteriaceae bacterium]